MINLTKEPMNFEHEKAMQELLHLRQALQIGMLTQKESIQKFLRNPKKKYTDSFWKYLNKSSETLGFNYTNFRQSDKLYLKNMIETLKLAEEIAESVQLNP